MSVATKIYRTKVVHSLGLNDLHIIERAAIGVGNDGRIKFLLDESSQRLPASLTSEVDVRSEKKARGIDLSQLPADYSGSVAELIADGAEVVNLPEEWFVVPGLVDTHAHAPQYSNAGVGYDLPLLEWLEKYTFPTETRFKDDNFAKMVFSRGVQRHLRCGTTTCAFFSSIHNSATRILADEMERVGMRGLIGKVNMDRNSPDNYIEKTDDSITATHEFVKDIMGRNNRLVTPIITPRFVPSCTPRLMKELAKIAKDYNLPIQTHISENKNEIAWVKDLHPECSSYADVYDKHGLLNEKTILAHGVHLTDDELKLIKERNASVSHCPISNFDLESGVMNIRDILGAGIKVGLGTDVSGGHSPSMLEVMRSALTGSKTHFFNNSKHDTLRGSEAFFLATMGGASVVGMEDKIGNFLPGKHFDALMIDTSVSDSPVDIFEWETLEERFQKWIYLGDDRNIQQIYVDGLKRTDRSNEGN